ncbi:MAG TPA: DMT family transporter [Acidimicrobiia bacterium]|nr:DMT family transporter [Acidimicrobiia bacterium]
MNARLRAFSPELALVVASILYGATFTIVQDALDDLTATGFILLRFAIGGIALLPLALRRGWRGPAARPADSARVMAGCGVALGVTAFVAYVCQNVGLQHTTTSNSAFITGLFAVFTPLVAAVVYRRLPNSSVVVSVVLAVIGLFLLTGAQPTLGFGDAITLVTAFAFGIWFVQVGAWANRFDVVSLTCVELLAIAAFSVPLVAFDGLGDVTAQALFAVVFTGLGCSAFAFSIQVWAQRRIEPARASIINLLEPVVAGFVGYEVGERLGWGGYLGAVIILAGILVAEVGARRRAPDPGVPSVT